MAGSNYVIRKKRQFVRDHVTFIEKNRMALSLYCTGSDDSVESRENAKLLRRVLMRRCLLMLVLLFRHISESVHNRFPELQDLVDFGINCTFKER